VLFITLFACGKNPPPPEIATDAGARVVHVDPSLVHEGRVKVTTVQARSSESERSIPGEVVAAEGAEGQVTSLVSGRVATLDAAVGQPVKKGQVLCVVESPEVGRAQADLLRAESRVLLTQRALDRQIELDAQNATSKSALDQARADAAAAKADVLAAKTMLSNIGAPMPNSDAIAPSGKVAMRAPIEGVVVERNAVLGGPVTAGTVLFRIVASGARVVMAKMPETLDATADEGTSVRIVARAAPDKACEGSIERNLHVVDATRNVPLRVRIGAACSELTMGSFVDVRLPARPGPKGLVVPASAIAEVHGETIAFVQKGEEGAFEARVVQRGPSSSGGEVEITSGIAAGDRVAVAGVVLLKGELLGGEMHP
jgi:cobalt-zinc-cadmium efflux system membrane fusion protein